MGTMKETKKERKEEGERERERGLKKLKLHSLGTFSETIWDSQHPFSQIKQQNRTRGQQRSPSPPPLSSPLPPTTTPQTDNPQISLDFRVSSPSILAGPGPGPSAGPRSVGVAGEAEGFLGEVVVAAARTNPKWGVVMWLILGWGWVGV